MDEALRKLLLHRREKEKVRPQAPKNEDKIKHIKEWTTFYRRNLDEYCVERLGIPLLPFQRVMMHQFGESMTFVGVASRGLGKI